MKTLLLLLTILINSVVYGYGYDLLSNETKSITFSLEAIQDSMRNRDFDYKNARRYDLGRYWDFKIEVSLVVSAEIVNHHGEVNKIFKKIIKESDTFYLKKGEDETKFNDVIITITIDEIKDLFENENIQSLTFNRIDITAFESNDVEDFSIIGGDKFSKNNKTFEHLFKPWPNWDTVEKYQYKVVID